MNRNAIILLLITFSIFFVFLFTTLRYPDNSSDKLTQGYDSEISQTSKGPLDSLSGIMSKKKLPTAIQVSYLETHDPIYSSALVNHITSLGELAREIVCTPPFQRLFKTSQLGNNFITHEHAFGSRAAHCKGVAKLSTTFARILADNSGIVLHPMELLAVQIAGLLHDVGHGPFSHLFEPIANKLLSPEKWDHETNSKNIVKYLFGNNPSWIQKYSLPDDFIEAICDMIVGIRQEEFLQKYSNSTTFNRFFLFTIVNAVYTHELDTDKMDYLMRDSFLTAKLSFCQAITQHVEKIVLNAKVINDQIIFAASTSYDCYQLTKLYYLLYRYLACHPIGQGEAILLGDALAELGSDLDLRQKLVSLDLFFMLTDSFFEETAKFAIENRSQHPKAAALFERYLRKQMYFLGGYRDFFYDVDRFNSTSIIQFATEQLLSKTFNSVSVDDFVFVIRELCFFYRQPTGVEEVNPMKIIPFHSVSFLHSIYQPSLSYSNCEPLFSPTSSTDICGYESNIHPIYYGTHQLRLFIKTLNSKKISDIQSAFSSVIFS